MKIVVDPEELKAVATKLEAFSGDYTDLYTNLMNVASTMGEAWQATDNLAFVEQITGFNDELKAMAERLLECSMALNQQAKNYDEVRNGNVTSVKQLAN
jgi:WXG100 family type VII secretion target